MTQPSSCDNIQLQQGGEYESITNNTEVYRSINTTGLTMTCPCLNESEISSWSLPADYTTDSSGCSQTGGICIMNKTLLFELLQRKHSGYYKCHVNSSSTIGFMLHVIGM